MSKKKKIYIFVFVFVALVCLSGFIWSYTVTKDVAKVQKSGAHNQVVSVKNLILTETKEEKIYWELYAEKGSYDSKSGEVVLTNPTGNFYKPDNEVAMSFESDLGSYSENTKKIILSGNTLVAAYDGSSIKADRIIIQSKQDDIIAEGNVVVTRNQDFVSYADKARFNSGLTFFEISGKTRTDVYTNEGSKPQELEEL